jgi:very-short-patch-repair endonuclease
MQFANVRRLSPAATERLWLRLRYGQLDGRHFRRHHQIGRLIVDFYCPEADLVVEIERTRAAADRRAELLAATGRRIMRFSEDEIIADTEQSVTRIAEALRAPRAASPPYRGAGISR